MRSRRHTESGRRTQRDAVQVYATSAHFFGGPPYKQNCRHRTLSLRCKTVADTSDVDCTTDRVQHSGHVSSERPSADRNFDRLAVAAFDSRVNNGLARQTGIFRVALNRHSLVSAGGAPLPLMGSLYRRVLVGVLVSESDHLIAVDGTAALPCGCRRGRLKETETLHRKRPLATRSGPTIRPIFLRKTTEP